MNDTRGAIEKWQQGYYQEKHGTPAREGKGKTSNGTGKQYIYTKRKRSRRTIEVVENKAGIFYLRIREGTEVLRLPIKNQEYFQKLSKRAREAYERKITSHRVGL